MGWINAHRALVILVVLLSALGLSACAPTPLPPLVFVYSPGAAQPAAPAAPVAAPPAETTTAPAVEVVAPETAIVQPAAAAPATAVVTRTAQLTSTAASAAEVSAADAVTPTVSITATAAITPARAAEAAATLAVQPTPTAIRVAPTATRAAPTATRAAPTATRAAPTATRAPTRPAATPTPQWPRTLVITAEDIEQGATSVPGLQISGLDVQFGNNTMTMSFDSLRYSFVSLRDVTVEGRFVVNNCDVDFVADRITPRNLATGAIPGFVNQSLDQQLGAWCVESLTVQPGQLVATVRPR